MVTSPIKERDKADTLKASIELNAVASNNSGCGPLSGHHQPSIESQIYGQTNNLIVQI